MTSFRHNQRVEFSTYPVGAAVKWEPATIKRARAGYNYRAEDQKCGAGFRMAAYKRPGEFIEGVWYIVQFHDGGALCMHESALRAAS